MPGDAGARGTVLLAMGPRSANKLSISFGIFRQSWMEKPYLSANASIGISAIVPSECIECVSPQLVLLQRQAAPSCSPDLVG